MVLAFTGMPVASKLCIVIHVSEKLDRQKDELCDPGLLDWLQHYGNRLDVIEKNLKK
jgi:hypothetical protein